ncbi:MAG: hypothetical protein NZ580_00135 [Bacteroidia bacterium]|nr:hypothetical protein [Bacteroidia bacterium]MDW8235068.1 hypothetical protein [Bacteroidia bacterium]
MAGSPLRAWVQAAKYRGNPHLLYRAARLLAHVVQQETEIPLRAIQGILAVPISAQRLRQRGYNQAEWVAKGFSEVWQIPVLKGYWRRSGGASQLTKTRTQRWTSLQTEFEWVKVPPFPVVVVDDVLTTGATLVAALQGLPHERQVWVCTVGITQRR